MSSPSPGRTSMVDDNKRRSSTSPNKQRSPSPSKGKNNVTSTKLPGADDHVKANGTDFSKVKKNSKGGVYVSKEDISAAFDMLDIEKNGSIHFPTLKKRLGIFFPEMTAREFRFLMNNKKEITLDDLIELIEDNDIQNYDPVAEAFKAYDPHSQGHIDIEKLKDIFRSYDMGELVDDEIDLIKRAADVDNDGLITLSDFRTLLDKPQTVAHKLSKVTDLFDDEIEKS